MSKRKLRDCLRLIESILFCWLYIPHILLYLCKRKFRNTIHTDLDRRKEKSELNMNHGVMFLYYIHTDRYFRNLFFHRTGVLLGTLIGWWRPGDRYFVISKTTKIGEGAYFVHPFSSEINAKSIGKNFSCRYLTTLGNNVIIGAGSVVVKNIPDNSVAVGNPCRVIKSS